MKLTGNYDAEILISLGAKVVAYHNDLDETHTDVDVNPDIVDTQLDLTNYATLFLQSKKAIAKTVLDTKASVKRASYLTDMIGQDDIYREKADQAVEYAAASYPVDTSPYPFVQAEANATGLTPTQAADSIIAARASWMSTMAAIEEERRKGKVNIDAATDEAGVLSARDAAMSALQAL